jgi:HK97 family phage major capsid protein
MGTMSFNKSKQLQDARAALSEALASGNAETQNEALANYLDALKNDVSAEIMTQVRNENADMSILAGRGQNALTSEEVKFFNAVVTDGGFKEESTLPVTTQERIFEDLTTEHPLLSVIGLENMGAVTRYIYSDPTLAYAWGPLFGDIKGQVNAAFHEEQVGQLKLTSFAVIPKDMLDLGPVWIERYVRTLLTESYSVGLEYGFVKGRGPAQNEPVGLMKNVDSETGAVTDKASEGTLTFAPSERGEVIVGELYDVVKKLSVDSKDKQRKVNNKIVMVVNPIDSIAIKAKNTIQTATGAWVNILPFAINQVESEEIPVGKALFFVQGYYKAGLAGNVSINKFDQTLAFEDAMLYTLKQFANGKPKDNKTALLYDLDITFSPVAAPQGA